MRSSRIGMIVVATVVSLGAVPAFAARGHAPVAHAAAQAAEAAKPAPHKLSMADARALALARVPGKIHAEELEKEHGAWIYSFEIVPDGGKAGEIKEVNVDADSGAIAPVETEKMDAKKSEHENDGEENDGEENDDAGGADHEEDGETAD